MRANTILAAAAAAAAALCLAGPAAAAHKPDPTTTAAAAEARVIDPQVLAKVVPGISKAQVKTLLGEPWRTVQYNDLDDPGARNASDNQFWEYRGKDAQGTYRVHIEFDTHGTVLIVGKIPDKAGLKGTRAES